MTDPTDRILRRRDLHAMVALDNFDAIAERVRNLLSHGRRITLVDRYIHGDHTPRVEAGLTFHEFDRWATSTGKGFTAWLKPGIRTGFGFSAHLGENDTEPGEWRRYHAGKSISDDPFKRRRDMTEVVLTGGLPGDGPARDDRLVIRAWNHDGMCNEQVVAFDYASDIRDEVDALTWELDEIRGFLCKYPTLTPELRAQALTLKPEDADPEMAVVERLREILRRHHPAMVVRHG